MTKILIVVASILILLIQSNALSQTPSDDPPRYEIAAEFTALNREQFGRAKSEPGAGVRFTFNFNKTFAIEGATHASFNECFDCTERGRVFDLFGGVKAGKRFKTWGVFAKVRPGVVNYTQGVLNIVPSGTGGPFPFTVEPKGVDHFALDAGAVVEFYPSRRLVTRFDFGDTLIHFSKRTTNGVSYDPTTMTYTLIPFTTPARTTHNFQFIASFGFRF